MLTMPAAIRAVADALVAALDRAGPRAGPDKPRDPGHADDGPGHARLPARPAPDRPQAHLALRGQSRQGLAFRPGDHHRHGRRARDAAGRPRGRLSHRRPDGRRVRAWPRTLWPARTPGWPRSSAPASRAGPSSRPSRPCGPLRKAFVVDVDPRAAAAFAAEMGNALGLEVEPADAPTALRDADIVSTATTSAVPVFRDGDLKPGVHINAVGSYKPHVREIPGETVRRAALFVDERRSALEEAGDILIPLREGLIGEGPHPGRDRRGPGRARAGPPLGRRDHPLQIRRQRRRGPGRGGPGPRLKDDHGVHQHPQRCPRAGHARAFELAHGRLLSHRAARPVPARGRAGPGRIHLRSRRLLRGDLPPAGRRSGPRGGPARLADHRQAFRPGPGAGAAARPRSSSSGSPRS